MIKQKYGTAMKDLRRVLDYPWVDDGFYAAWLTQSYFYTSRGTRILMLAGAHVPMTDFKTHRRFMEHAREEKGHELLAQRDVQDLGFDVHKIGELPITKAFYQSQYYNIQHESIPRLFGWIIMLEGLAIEHGKQIRQAVLKKGENRPTRFLDIHVDEDPDHVEKAFEIMSGFSHEDQLAVCENMEFAVQLYFHILQDCAVLAQNLKHKAAA